MNPEIHERQIVEIIKRVSANHRIEAVVVPMEAGENPSLNITVEYFFEPCWKKRETAIVILMSCAAGFLLGHALARHWMLAEVDCATILACVIAGWAHDKERKIANDNLHPHIDVALRQHGYEVRHTETGKSISWA